MILSGAGCRNWTGDLLITNQTNEERASKFNSTGCSHSGFRGVFEDSIRSYIASSCVYLNSRHNHVTSHGNYIALGKRNFASTERQRLFWTRPLVIRHVSLPEVFVIRNFLVSRRTDVIRRQCINQLISLQSDRAEEAELFRNTTLWKTRSTVVPARLEKDK